jgi:hypothetical protein
VHWGCYYATALDIEVDPQRCCLGSCQSDFALQAVVECRALGSPRVSIYNWCPLKKESSSLRFPGEPQKHIGNSARFPPLSEGSEASCPAVGGDGRAKETWDMGTRGDLGQRSAIQDESSRADQPGRANGTRPELLVCRGFGWNVCTACQCLHA